MMNSLNSEGITFKRPRLDSSRPRLNASGKRKRDLSTGGSIDVEILRTFEEPFQTIERRTELYEETLGIVTNHFTCQQEKCNRGLGESLDRFIKSSVRVLEKDENTLPIGILESGLSMSENSKIFDHIQTKLKDVTALDQKVYVARVQSATSPSTKAVFQKICRQLVNDVTESVDDDESDTETSTLKHFSVYDVKSFLKKEKDAYKIVIIVEDADYFSNSIISQLLTLMGCAKLPVIFLFGATHGCFINNQVPLSSSFAFVVDKFYSVSPKERLDDFMKRILFDPVNPFRISGPVAQYLESQYIEENFSVENIYQAIKFCIRSHFLTAKSAFCTLRKSENYEEFELKTLTKLETELDSTKETPRKRQKNELKIEQLLDTSIDRIQNWHLLLRLLCCINSSLTSRPLGKSHLLVYTSCYEGYTTNKENDESSTLHKFFNCLSSLSKSKLEDLIDDCTHFLQKEASKRLSTGNDLISDIMSKLAVYKKEIIESEKMQDATILESQVKSIRLKKIKSVTELQKSLQEIKRNKDGTSTLHKVRTDIIGYIRSLLKKYLVSFPSIQLSNIFVFSDLSLLISTLYPANYLQLNEDMTVPAYFLNCSCCSALDSSAIDRNLPDLSIIHKLIAERTTKKVDLNSVYHAFVSVVDASVKKTKANQASATASYLKRFRRAIGELQHMGFVKRSKSRPDEINRLTWW